VAVDPSTTACHVRGLATPLAALTSDPTGARSAGASLGFPLQGVLLGAQGAPLGVPALLTLPARPPPPRRGALPARPPPGPCTRVELVQSPGSPKGPGRRCLPGVHPSRTLLPSVRAIASSHDAGLRALQQVDVPVCLGLKASRCGRLGLSVSGLPALLGFGTFRPSWHSVHRPGGWAHVFTSRSTARMTRVALAL
jgi:hypothetical protein